ncbi:MULTISPECIES: thiol-disulfide oxidoreductase DCC family protein [Halorussus]|uniref:thiol-disulfide oxidoreductase DCC family protein n=1 Tax=Halorussus TaxID=1070314 RepID=UPI00209CADCC|nr:thiol-disulfide oxidoreductase DCC family protein [Halorussus vallis]USZ75505.1 thiol-disulfide oxidoreductase DCC family protein [Halorussus vallis]
MSADGPDRADPADVSDDHPVLLFDGVCNLCNGAIQFVVDADPDAVFRFAPLQSPVGRDLLASCGLPTDEMDTVVLVEDGECYTKSAAALRVARRLGVPYSLLWPFRFVPRPIRDAVYDVVAANRYRWFGRREGCMVPSPDVESRFLDRN